MASINGVSSSNTVSSLMNSANTITGLASGLDTESMIENLVKSYQTKIDSLNKKITKTEWKQDSYRNIISKMVGFSSKYTSYTSATNLASPSFFSSAVKVATQGLFSDRVAASGKTSSDISLDKVTQLATAAQYRTAGNLKAGDGTSIAADFGLDESGNPMGLDLINGTTELGRLSGSLTLTYGAKAVSVSFDEVGDVKALQEIKEKKPGIGEDEALAQLIEQKLADQTITLSNGKTESADKRIKVEAKNGVLTFSDKSTAGNSVYMSGASGNVASTLGLDLKDASTNRPASFTLSDKMKKGLTYEENNAEYLSGKLMNLNLDGTTKQITMPTVKDGRLVDAAGNPLKDANGKDISRLNADNYTAALNSAVQKAIKGNKITVENADETGKSLRLNFKVQEGSDLVINTSVGETLGIGRSATSYLNTSKTLGDLLEGMDDPEFLSGLTKAIKKDSEGNIIYDRSGNAVYDVDDKGEQKYEFKINGVVVGNYSKNSKLSDIMADINANSEAGVRVSYSQTTKNFLFTSKETGLESSIEMGEGLAQAMFGSTEISGESPKFADAYGVKAWANEVSFKFSGDTITLNNFDKDSTIEDIAERLNKTFGNSGRVASYNKYTGQLEVKDKNGETVDFEAYVDDEDFGRVDFEFKKEYAPKISYTPGQDAKFTVTVNGEQKEMTRSSNTVNIDGLTITMKDTFSGYEDADGNKAVTSTGAPKNSVTFKSTTDADKIVDAVKAMIEDYNAMMSEIKSAYSTLPYQKTNGSFANYEPLTDDEKSGMTESAIERYEAKAKQGILFGDRNLSSLYEKMRSAFNLAGADGAALRAMGITSTFSITDSGEAITLDESKLREMLESDPDKVADVFTKTGGVMQNLKTQLDTYSKTTGEPKGILIQQAGSPLSSLSLMNNTWQKEIDNINTQIEKWQDKLTSQVERYTSQFSRLEQLINQMNSQSSTLQSMMGG